MRIAVLGAGISGRLAKVMMPEATVFEGKPKKSLYTAHLGVHISISPIPGLLCTKYTRFVLIDGQKSTMDLIQKYHRKINRENPLGYGDLRQFEPEQIVYRSEFPMDLPIEFEKSVKSINLFLHKIYFTDGTEHDYDYLVNTIPLMDFLKLTDLLEHFCTSWNKFFMHRPIYMQVQDAPVEELVIRENYLTDPEDPVYRENFIEGKHNRESLFKIGEDAFKIYPGKIYNHSDTSHILEDLKNYQVFCCGRYAQWNNKIHLWNTYGTLKTIKEEIYGR